MQVQINDRFIAWLECKETDGTLPPEEIELAINNILDLYMQKWENAVEEVEFVFKNDHE